jgi:hypothetical protein
MRQTARWAIAAAVAAGLAGGWRPAQAAGVVGTGTPASCTEATLAAALAGGGRVTFDCGPDPHTILLTSPKTITQPTTLAGADRITLSGNNATRLLVVDPAASLTLEGLTITAGYATTDGGAVVNHGTLNVFDTTFIGNNTDNAHSGGAIFSDGPLNIYDSDFTWNSAGSAGAIFANFANAVTHIERTDFTGNSALNPTTGYGGAIWVGEQARLELHRGRVLYNAAKFGGALFASPGARVQLTSEGGANALQIERNSATSAGGAIYNMAALSAAEVNLFQNEVPTQTAAYGGAIYSQGTLTLTNSLFVGNTANSGGAVYAAGIEFAAAPGAPAGTGAKAVLSDGSYFYANEALYGAAIYAASATTSLTIVDSGFLENKASLTGGALYRINAPLSINRSAFTGNRAGSLAGGLALFAVPSDNPGVNGVALIRNTSLSQNQAPISGALHSDDAVSLVSVTAKDNTSGVFNNNQGMLYLRNTVLQNDGPNCGGTDPIDRGFNYATDTSCGFSTSTQGAGLDPLLGPLTEVGNQLHYPPLPGSPLINTGWPDCDPLDELRAQRRDTCDIGAVEFGGLLARLWMPFLAR